MDKFNYYDEDDESFENHRVKIPKKNRNNEYSKEYNGRKSKMKYKYKKNRKNAKED